jgi:hypothetical protein
VGTLKKVSNKAPALEVCLSHPPLAVKAEILSGAGEVKAKDGAPKGLADTPRQGEKNLDPALDICLKKPPPHDAAIPR